jgi:hypothetical protein
MIETVIALLMIVNNEIKEARIQNDLSTCLKGKRLAMRQVKNNSNVIYSCVKTKAELESNIDGSVSIKKLIVE